MEADAGQIAHLEEETVFDEWRRHRATARRSLPRARLFAAELGLALRGPGQLPLVGVVGSKGKGTIALYASAALAAAGHRVGTVTSPGVLSNRDRIRIDGRALAPAGYRDLLETVRAAGRRLPPIGPDGGYLSPTGTFTLAGAHALAEAGCTALVLEAGIGGASDELSLFAPDVVALGAVFGEHLDLLGPTVADVARDKLGVVTDRTRAVVTVAQGPEATAEVRRVSLAHAAETVSVDPSRARGETASLLPPGFGAANALAGIRAGCELLAVTGRDRPSEGRLAEVLRTVRYPGRLSTHEFGAGDSRLRLVLDTAVSGVGLAVARGFAARAFGRSPDRVLVSLPAAKDFDGFLDELRGLDCPRYFVELRRGHLVYPDRSRWPWQWIAEDALPEDLLRGDVLAVGTVSFVTALMNRLDIDAEQLFRA
ncbi:MAG TPA: hypothetical protein VGX23_08625 [Actinocrinis sp.]|nr:hypothetical protein [Actinocrinis sp.]